MWIHLSVSSAFYPVSSPLLLLTEQPAQELLSYQHSNSHIFPTFRLPGSHLSSPVPLPSPFPAPFFPHPTPSTLIHLLIPSFKIKEPGYRKRVGKAGKRVNKEQMLIYHEEGKKGWVPSQTSSFYLWRCSVCPQMKVREREISFGSEHKKRRGVRGKE